ncbi:MAG: flippase-like domain-containing protein [Bacteroidaceae bacterium]|nr:flippase-like domain-containing protein [Bacteroidaceae bacterium]
MKKITSTTLKILIPLLISAVILFFTYRDYDFSLFWADMKRIDWRWLAAALAFSAFGPLFRGLRWNLLLEPIGYDVPKKDTVLTVFTGYAANIIVPRVGEVSRCAILERNAGVPFSKGLGTLVAERVVDAVLLGLIVLAGILSQLGQFSLLLAPTDADLSAPAAESVPMLQNPKFWYWTIGTVIVLAVCWWACIKFRLWDKVKGFIHGFWEGFLSLRKINRLPLFIIYSVSIWICYYFELYLAFYCLPSTAAVGPIAGLACFAASSVAVLVPTPNGAGPWHYAIVKMLGIYGAPEADAQPLAFVLHFCQTMIYLLCGLIAWIVLKLIHHNDPVRTKIEI